MSVFFVKLSVPDFLFNNYRPSSLTSALHLRRLLIRRNGSSAAAQPLMSVQSYDGQFIMGGFLNLRLKKWSRALITRSCAILPTIIVALIFNRSESSLDVLNEWLNVLQSVQIPFALIPLLTFVSNEQVMGSFKIGPTLEKVAWAVATLVMVINGYLLLDFFSSEVGGLLFVLLFCAGIIAYLSFIFYLISYRHGWFFTKDLYSVLSSNTLPGKINDASFTT